MVAGAQSDPKTISNWFRELRNTNVKLASTRNEKVKDEQAAATVKSIMYVHRIHSSLITLHTTNFEMCFVWMLEQVEKGRAEAPKSE